MCRRLPRAAAFTWCAIAAGLADGCAPRPGPAHLHAQLEEAERLCLDAKFDEARPLLKAYLLDDPFNPGAHFYLGRTYLLSRPALAEGEYQTALRLFIRQGRVSPTKRLSPEYFELMCDVDSAKALWLEASLAPGQQSSATRDPLAQAHRYLDHARQSNPGAPEIESVETLLRELNQTRRRSSR